MVRLLFLLVACFLCVSNAETAMSAPPSIKDIALFLGTDEKGVHIECPQNTFSFVEDQREKSLKLCLRPQDREKRCEITVTSLEKSPQGQMISFDLRQDRHRPSSLWHTVMQIQSFPDKGEAWRCPPYSLEIVDGTFRSYNRWDTSPLSLTTGNNCTEIGSSIRSRTILSGFPVQYDDWQHIALSLIASPYQNGQIALSIDKRNSRLIHGGTIYNDQRNPYLKLGIYKPTGWENWEMQVSDPLCVSYKNVKIENFKAQ